MNKKDSLIISFLRLPLSIAVIIIHIPLLTRVEKVALNVSDIDVLLFFNLSQVEKMYLLRYLFSTVISAVAVPCFFLMAGYLMYYKLNSLTKEIYIKKLKVRKKSLLYPYIIWNIIAIVPLSFIEYVKHVPISEWVIMSSPIELFQKVFWMDQFGFPINYPLWFCRDLMLLSIISPVFYWSVKSDKWYILPVIGVLYFFFPSTPNLGISIFFYVFGLYLGVNGKSLVCNNKLVVCCLALINFLGLVLCLLYHDRNITTHIFLPCFITTGVFLLFVLASKIVTYRSVKFWLDNSHTSFFIYLCQAAFIIPVFAFIRVKLTVNYVWLKYFLVFVAPFIGMLMGITYYKLLKKVSPRLIRFLSGGR